MTNTICKNKISRKVGIKNNIVIPIDLARMYNIKPSCFISFEPYKNGIIIKKSEDPIKKANGILKSNKSSVDIKKEIRDEEKIYENKKLKF